MVAVVVLVVLVLVGVASRIQLNYYALTPGHAQAVGPLVKVPPGKAHPSRGPILLTDVYVTQLSLLDYLPNLFDANAQVVSAAELLGPYTPSDQLTAQGYVEMAQSQAAAKAAALSRLGYAVPEHDAGALVFAVAPRVAIGTGVEGRSDRDGGQWDPDGQRLRLRDRPAALRTWGYRRSVGGAVQGHRQRRDPVGKDRAGTDPSGQAAGFGLSGGDRVPGGPYSFQGLPRGGGREPSRTSPIPFPVSVDTSQIGGPSAGLAMTLAIVDKLSTGHLTAGRSVAATGTISPTGAVGDVGGVPQKTVAVEQAGATVFFVPPQEYSAAKSKDIPSLRIYPVASLDRALAILATLGGQVPPAPVQPGQTPHSG